MVSRVVNSIAPNPTSIEIVEKCIDVMGSIRVSNNTKQELDAITQNALENETEISREAIVQLFKLIGSSREYQLC